MGGGPTERILCVLPLEEPKEQLQHIRNRFPDIEITYVHNKIAALKSKIPKGELDDLFKRDKQQLEQANASNGTASNDTSNGYDATNVSNELFKDKTMIMTLTVLPETVKEAPNLRLVHLFSAGSDIAVNHPLFLDTDITFTNSSGVHGPQITEWAVMMLLTHNHHYNPMYESQKLHKWDRQWAWGLHDLVGQRVGILGYGAIGRQFARVTKAMGMEVYAYTATPKETPEARRDTGFIVPGTGDPDGSIPTKWFSGLEKESLHHFLAQKLDVILVSVPLTPDTHHFLGTPEFEILAKHPPLIANIARGPIIDQPALVKALHSGAVGSAALDVTDPEPLPADDPLWSAPNVTITPHISGASSSYLPRSFAVLEENLARLQEKKPLVNVVSRKKGY